MSLIFMYIIYLCFSNNPLTRIQYLKYLYVMRLSFAEKVQVCDK